MNTEGQVTAHTLSLPLAILMATLASGCHVMNGYTTNELGRYYHSQGNYTAAADTFRRAAIDDPQNADYVYNYACALRQKGDDVNAEQAARQAIQINPGHQPSYHLLAMMLNDQGRTAEARDLLQAWADTQPYNPESNIELAWLQRETGDLTGAENSLQQALQTDPTNAIATAHLGQVYQDAGQTDAAAAMYQRSLYTNWFQPDVRSRLSSLPPASQQRANSAIAAARMPGPYGTTAAAYPGAPHRVARIYPLPTYSQATTPVMATVPGTIQPQPIQLGQPIINGDPAHVPQLSSQIPVTEAY